MKQRAMSPFGPSRPNFTLRPDVSFRRKAELGRAAEPAPRWKMTVQRG